MQYVEHPRHLELKWVLRECDGRLELLRTDEPREPGLVAEYRIDPRPHAPGRSRRQPLARALGPRSRLVLDATAGLGYDAVLMASVGYEVTAVERNPMVAALLADGLRRAREDPAIASLIDGRIRVVEDDARNWLEAEPWDAVYVDPMFPPKRKRSALPPKRVRWLRDLVGDDDDACDLLDRARAACPRVIVKRADDGPPLGGREPSTTIRGKIVRYDVYLDPRG